MKTQINRILNNKLIGVKGRINKKPKETFTSYFKRNEPLYIKEKNITFMMNYMDNLKYVETAEHELMATRDKLYYNKSILEKSDKELIEIVMSEVFNNMQQPRTIVSQATKNIIISNTLIMLSSIDVIKERIKFGIKNRNKTYKTFDYSNYNVVVPNEDTLKHNYKLLTEGRDMKIYKIPFYRITEKGFVYSGGGFSV